MNPIIKFIMKFASSPRIDIQEDYTWIRKVQKLFYSTSKDEYQFLDKKIYAPEEGHEIPVRIFIQKKDYMKSILFIYMVEDG